MNSIKEKIILKISFLLSVLIILIIFSGCGKASKKADKTSVEIATDKENVRVDSAAVPRTVTRQELDKLKGKWQRTDGGYVIEIFSLDDAGNINAGYFNPNPINVEKAQWIFREDKIYIRVILRDVNYPGSTYTLEYKADNDYLIGNYFQAVEGSNYDVIFTRKN